MNDESSSQSRFTPAEMLGFASLLSAGLSFATPALDPVLGPGAWLAALVLLIVTGLASGLAAIGLSFYRQELRGFVLGTGGVLLSSSVVYSLLHGLTHF